MFKKTILASLICVFSVSNTFAKTEQTKIEPKKTETKNKIQKTVQKPIAKKEIQKKTVQIKSTPKPTVVKHTPVKVSLAFPKNLESQGVYIMEEGHAEPVFEKNADKQMSIASITKLMTAMVALESKESLEDMITIGSDDIDTVKNSKSRLPTNLEIQRSEALKIALMASENRAAHSLARNYPEGILAFVRKMNEKAKSLGMTNTHFVDPTGLSPENVSTPRDLAKMVSTASRYPEIREYSTLDKYSLQSKNSVIEYKNTNPLVKSDNWEINVSKTGYIQEAGRCLVMATRINDKPMRMIFLDSAHKSDRVEDAIRTRQWLYSIAERKTQDL